MASKKEEFSEGLTLRRGRTNKCLKKESLLARAKNEIASSTINQSWKMARKNRSENLNFG